MLESEHCHSSQYHGTVVKETTNAITHRVIVVAWPETRGGLGGA